MGVQASARITLKLISFAMIIVGVIILLMGISFIFSVGWMQSDPLLRQEAEANLHYSARELALGLGIFMAGSIVLIVGGAVAIVTGIFGSRAANHPLNAGPAFGAGVVAMLLAIADLVLMIVVGTISPYGDPVQFVTSLVMSGITIVVSVVFLVMTHRVHRGFVTGSA